MNIENSIDTKTEDMKTEAPKILVVYHSADFDGIACREVVRHAYEGTGVQLTFVGWNHGDKPVEFLDEYAGVIVMDLPPSCVKDYKLVAKDMLWIDHHASSIAQHDHMISGLRVDGVAACRLAWYVFVMRSDHNVTLFDGPGTTGGKGFEARWIKREVDEPRILTLLGEHDVFDHRDKDSRILQVGLRARQELVNSPAFWATVFSSDTKIANTGLNWVLSTGKPLFEYEFSRNAACAANATRMTWEGFNWLVMSCGPVGSSSLMFESVDFQDVGHDALLVFKWLKDRWSVSVYEAKHNHGKIDVSVVALKHGGGGHKGAAGFSCSELPFIKELRENNFTQPAQKI